MNIITKQISELKPYGNNPKIHTEKQIEQIAKSIELTKGLRQPIVIDKNNVIVCGHGRYLAAKKLGYVTVPCELVNDLTDDEIRAYRLIDNRISEGKYDLSLEFEELSNISLDLSGFELPTIEFPKEEQEQERERDGYFGDARENTYRSTNFDRYEGEVFITEPPAKEGQWSKTSDVPIYKAGENDVVLEKTNGYVTRAGNKNIYIQKYGRGYALNYKGRVDGNYSSLKEAKEAAPKFVEKLQRASGILDVINGEFAILNKNKGRVSKSVMKEISSDDRRRISERVYK